MCHLGRNHLAKNLVKVKTFSLRSGIDIPFLCLVLLVLGVGLIMLASASYPNAKQFHGGDSFYFIRNQLMWAIIGVVAMLMLSFFDYHYLHKLAMPILGISFLLLIVVLFMPLVNQVHRWIQIGPLSFQPSEITKFAIVLSFAHMMSINFKRMGTFRYGILPYAIILLTSAFLLFKEPHISCLIIIVLLSGGCFILEVPNLDGLDLFLQRRFWL